MPEHEEENKDSLANKSSDFSPSDAQVSNSFLQAPTKLEIWGILIPILGIVFVVIFLFFICENTSFVSADWLSYKKSQEAKALADESKRKSNEEYCEAHGEVPASSPLDGTIYLIENYLKETLNDPDSLKVYTTTLNRSKDGYVVLCDYGAKNAYGGMIRKSTFFVINKGRITLVYTGK